ncbi:MAG: hypothetical protein A3F84_17895 [Candidatus Handelsmanbacteria bacterium RIFCSPLOWO2_12_FULL_64_10]|uniref:Uncharacterized protein n=1 Tax=Handelsmanbacteria sp. (strain RIFCSPLOWO2_12_FULL_64_10) TaxID=1817868 RepID=A0A1F6CQ06_HANXR|nr:MAG: hypothetical protein A3F84_17895 [Candidatus Handelsmanbacteria bacterium RIFCSPLOWO2_12_FULL_64_10]
MTSNPFRPNFKMVAALLILVVLSGLFPRAADAEVPSLPGARADSLYGVALRLRDEGDREGAIAALRQVVAEDPRRTLAYCHLGHLFFDQQEVDVAEMDFKRALDVDDRCAEAYYGLGRVYRRRPKERLKAIQHFRSALARDSKHVEAMYELAMTQLELDDYDAKTSFEDLIRADPEHPDAYYELGRWFEKSRRLEDATRSYERQIRVNPGHPMAQKALRSAYSKIRSARRLGDVEIVFDLRDAGGAGLDGRGPSPVLQKGQKVTLDYRIYPCGTLRPQGRFRVEAALDESTGRGVGRSIGSALGRMVGRRWDVFLIPFELAGITPVQRGSVELDVEGVRPGDRRIVVRAVHERQGLTVERDMVVVVK